MKQNQGKLYAAEKEGEGDKFQKSHILRKKDLRDRVRRLEEWDLESL